MQQMIQRIILRHVYAVIDFEHILYRHYVFTGFCFRICELKPNSFGNEYDLSLHMATTQSSAFCERHNIALHLALFD